MEVRSLRNEQSYWFMVAPGAGPYTRGGKRSSESAPMTDGQGGGTMRRPVRVWRTGLLAGFHSLQVPDRLAGVQVVVGLDQGVWRVTGLPTTRL